MRYIDFHADTITELKEGETLAKSQRMVTLQELQQAECLVQCFSAFVPTGFFPEETRDPDSWKEYQRIAARYQETLQAYPEQLKAIRTAQDLEDCLAEKKIGTLFTIEDGGVLGGRMENLHRVYEDGVRLITLTWNHANAIGFPNSPDPEENEKGLTAFGMDLIEEMQTKRMLIDVSHLSDGGFWDVCSQSRIPFVASHSNARALTPHPRNLTDKMIRAIAEHGGIIGLNLYGPFLSEDGGSRVADMVRHIAHIYQKGGEEVLALGSDFDGIHGELEIQHPTELWKLYAALLQAGYPDRLLEKFWYGNGLRVLREVL